MNECPSFTCRQHLCEAFVAGVYRGGEIFGRGQFRNENFSHQSFRNLMRSTVPGGWKEFIAEVPALIGDAELHIVHRLPSMVPAAHAVHATAPEVIPIMPWTVTNFITTAKLTPFPIFCERLTLLLPLAPGTAATSCPQLAGREVSGCGPLRRHQCFHENFGLSGRRKGDKQGWTDKRS